MKAKVVEKTTKKGTKKGLILTETKPKGKKPLAKEVSALKKDFKKGQSIYTYKAYGSTDLASAVASMAQTSVAGFNVSQMQTALTTVPIYDPSTNDTVPEDFSSGTYNRELNIKSITSGLTVRNNYQVPCDVRIYLLKAKTQSTTAPTTLYSDGIADQYRTTGDVAPASTFPDIYPTEIDMLTSQFTIKLLKHKFLEAGQQISASHSEKDISFNPAVYDTTSLNYSRQYKTFVFLVRIQGAIAHDTVADQQGITPCQVDIEHYKILKLMYDAGGVKLNDYFITDSRASTFTNSGVLSNKPVADNQAYSVS